MLPTAVVTTIFNYNFICIRASV